MLTFISLYLKAFKQNLVQNGSVLSEKIWFEFLYVSDFIWPFLPPYIGVIPNPKMAFILPISCILALIFPIFMKYFPKCSGKGSFPKSQIKSLYVHDPGPRSRNDLDLQYSHSFMKSISCLYLPA